MNASYSGRTVLLTGAGGCIGSALAKALATFDPRVLILLDHSERNLHQIKVELADIPRAAPCVPILGDICDGALIDEIFECHRPDIIFHSAAFKHVPLMETNPIAAIRNNSLGTNILAKAARAQGVAGLIMVSTDKAVNPRSVMGASKRVAELALLRWSTSSSRMRAVRLGNVLGTQGSVVPIFLRQISGGGPVTVTHPEARRYFLTLSETIELILSVSGLEGGGGIFIPDLGEPVRILDLAHQVIEEAGFEPEREIPIAFTQLRPGEKLAEYLVSGCESVEPTSNARLSRIETTEILSDKFDAQMEALAKSVNRRDLPALLEILLQIVPEYRPSDSLLDLREGSSA